MKLIVSIFFLLVGCSIFAQGELQFNQVKFIELSLSYTTSVVHPKTFQTITVPAGKVWKIESAIASNKDYVNPTDYQIFYGGILTLNDKTIYNGASSGFLVGNVLPIWLPAGTYTLMLSLSCNTCSSGSYPATTVVGSISAIEFNIVP
ncbi:MAG: hypothetical protein SFW35_05625 [Chitinophagales bacterium]|nr:hypothetical protein [Chitinophagales bacterium]